VLARHPRVAIDRRRQIRHKALIDAPFENGAHEVGLSGNHDSGETENTPR